MTKTFAIAVGLTLLDAATVAYCGPVIWQIFGQAPWSRVSLLLITGTGAFTLANVWRIALRPPLLRIRSTEGTAAIASGPLGGGADV
jgi:hypothetical protein